SPRRDRADHLGALRQLCGRSHARTQHHPRRATQTSRIDCAVKQYNMKVAARFEQPAHAHGKTAKIDGLFTLNFPITETSHIAFAHSLVTTTRKIGLGRNLW